MIEPRDKVVLFGAPSMGTPSPPVNLPRLDPGPELEGEVRHQEPAREPAAAPTQEEPETRRKKREKPPRVTPGGLRIVLLARRRTRTARGLPPALH